MPAPPSPKPPAGATATTLKSDRNCAESWQAGRRDFDGWLSSVTTVQGAIDEGLPVMKLGDQGSFVEGFGLGLVKRGMHE